MEYSAFLNGDILNTIKQAGSFQKDKKYENHSTTPNEDGCGRPTGNAMDWIMLLKNDGALPLSQEIKKLAFIGLFGARLGTLFGGYAYPLMLELLSTQVWVGTDSCLKPE